MSKILFTDANIIPMNEEVVLEGMDLLISDGKIEKIGENLSREDFEVVSLNGKYIMPGLYDMHAHLYYSEDELSLYLANGITSIRNMMGEPKFNEWRDKINSGELVGPTVHNFGQILDGDPPVRPADKHNVTLTSVAQAKEEVLRQKKEGYDFIKVYDNLPKDIYMAIAETANSCDMKFAGHLPKAVTLEEAIDAGQWTFEHMFYVKEEAVDQAAKNNSWICPTMIVLKNYTELFYGDADKVKNDERVKYTHPEIKKLWKMLDDFDEEMIEKYKTILEPMRYELQKPVLGKAYAKGCPLLLGTDTPNPYVMAGFSLHDELKLLIDCGLSTYDALKSGTVNAALCLDELNLKGSVEEGKIADLLILGDNPLEDIKHTTSIEGVVTKGDYLKKSDIDQMLMQIEKYNERLFEAK